LSGTARKARALFSAYYAYMLEYRAEILLWAISNILPLIMMGIWMQVSSKPGFDGPSAVEFARYFLAVFIIRQFTVVWVIWEFEVQVVEGKLSPFLLQPMDPVWRFLAGHIAERVTRLPFSIGFIILFFVLYPKALYHQDQFWSIGIADAAIVILMVTMTFLVRFTMQYTFAMLAFWVERASAIERFWWIPYLFLSGLVAPLDVFPQGVKTFAYCTPFPYLLYYPAAVLIHGYENVDISFTQAVGVLGAWGVGFFLLNRWLWRLGLKHYSAMGA